VTPPRREEAYIVFAQRTDARIDIESWNAHAMRFFATRIGLTSEKRTSAGEVAPRTDEAAFVVAPDGEAPGIRSTFARPCEHDDHVLAVTIEARAGHTGLSLLARRCGMVWLVVREGTVDPLALRLSAIIASILLGPIVDASAGLLFGAKTARAMLETAGNSPPADKTPKA
jgi:hypothetical protein